MNTELLSKLKSMNPDVDGWGYDERIDTNHLNDDDFILLTLAPSMREELLKMEEEMEKMRQLLLLLSSCNEEHKDYRSIAGLILKSRELLNQPQP